MTHRPKILVIDDQIGIEGGDRDIFLSRIGAVPKKADKQNPSPSPYPYDFAFHPGSDAAGRNSVDAVIEAILRGWPDPKTGRHWALVLLDVRFGNDQQFGFTILRAIREHPKLGAELPVVMLTSEDKGKREQADRLRADGFLPKVDEQSLKTMLSREELAKRVTTLGLIEDDRPVSQRLLGHSLSFLKVLRQCRSRAQRIGQGVVLYGETGTGKSELAVYIHHHSPRRDGPFVPWVADPANKELMKDELFGHWQGAHSEAHTHQAGKIESAHGGTFFLDEVANLPIEVQQAFLKFRKEDHEGWRTISRQGKFPSGNPAEAKLAAKSVVEGAEMEPASHDIRVQVQVITGTNVNLEDASERERRGFMSDLHNALGHPIHCPSLNERCGDVRELFQHFVERALAKAGQPRRTFSVESEVWELLEERDWSQRGNVRDLDRIAQHAASELGDFDTIYRHKLPSDVSGAQKHISVAASPEPPARPAVAAPPSISPPDDGAGLLASLDVAHLRRRVESLESFAEQTRKPDLATGQPGRYQPTAMISRMLGVEVTPMNAKRIIGGILKDILDTPEYLATAYRSQGLDELRSWVSARPVLVDLHQYAKGQKKAEEIGSGAQATQPQRKGL